jgi:hypothetical protein
MARKSKGGGDYDVGWGRPPNRYPAVALACISRSIFCSASGE